MRLLALICSVFLLAGCGLMPARGSDERVIRIYMNANAGDGEASCTIRGLDDDEESDRKTEWSVDRDR